MKIPASALLVLTAFGAATTSGLLQKWISLLSGWSPDPAITFTCIALGTAVAVFATVVARFP